MGDVNFKNVWRQDNSAFIDEVIHLWTENNILPQDVTPEERASELCALAYDGDELVGMTTGVVRYMRQLRSKAVFIRTFIDPKHRMHSAGRDLTAKSKEFLSQWSEDNPELEIRGMATIVQSKLIKQMPRYGVPVWNKTKLAVVGFTRDDEQIRFTWFDHIMLPSSWDDIDF